MTLREEIYNDINDIPENTLQILHQFVRFLKENPADVTDNSGMGSQKKRDRPRLLGVLEGQVWISDDFNDPMDFVSEEEQRMLEVMRASKKQEHELHEAAI